MNFAYGAHFPIIVSTIQRRYEFPISLIIEALFCRRRHSTSLALLMSIIRLININTFLCAHRWIYRRHCKWLIFDIFVCFNFFLYLSFAPWGGCDENNSKHSPADFQSVMLSKYVSESMSFDLRQQFNSFHRRWWNGTQSFNMILFSWYPIGLRWGRQRSNVCFISLH